MTVPEPAPEAEAALRALLEGLRRDPEAPTSVRDPSRAWRVHIADSLSGLEIPELRIASRIGDVGSGAGFPGLPLAVVLPEAHVDLIESTGRKCDFMRRTLRDAEVANAAVLCERAEVLALHPPPDGRREAYEVVTARAVGRMATLAELASPLLRDNGVLIAWKGRRDAEEEAELARAAERLAMEPREVRWVGPYAGSRNRHIHVVRKAGPTPEGLPRRPGMAKKRPLGADGR